jgi:septum formation protein
MTPASSAPDSPSLLVLASASPRRSAILTELGLPHQVDPADLVEVRAPGESPEAYVERLAREKALAVAHRHPAAHVLAGDTTVALDDRILEKPVDADDAVAILLSLAGREHRVATGLALVTPEGQVHAGVEVTRVRFRAFHREEARAYVATGEPMDKAGAYGIQGLGGALVEAIEGDFSAVVGLSVPLLLRLLEEGGIPWSFPRAKDLAASAPPSGASSHLPRTLAALFQRELGTLARQLRAYPDAEAIWSHPPGTPNPAGTLALHLSGNLRHFLGAVLGNDGYQRDRAREFEARGLPLSTLLEEVEAAREVAVQVLAALDPAALARPWPGPLPSPPGGPGGPVSTEAFLLHLLSHLAYHLGQVDQHRRSLAGGESTGAMALSGLPSIAPEGG